MKAIDSILYVYNIISPVLDVAVLTFLLYKVYSLIIKTNGMQIIRAFLIVIAAYAISALLQLQTIMWLFNMLAPGFVVAFAIVFQPEMRKLFLKLGQNQWFNINKRAKHSHINAVLTAAELLSEQRRGMLAVFVRHSPVEDWLKSGERLNAELSSSLLVTIFGKDTPLHDGACFIQGGKLVGAGCFLPLSEQYDIKKTFGTRHRAALGLSEQTDCVVLVVSEETGAISLCYDSKLHYDLKMPEILKILNTLLEIKSDSSKEEEISDEFKKAD